MDKSTIIPLSKQTFNLNIFLIFNEYYITLILKLKITLIYIIYLNVYVNYRKYTLELEK